MKFVKATDPASGVSLASSRATALPLQSRQRGWTEREQQKIAERQKELAEQRVSIGGNKAGLGFGASGETGGTQEAHSDSDLSSSSKLAVSPSRRSLKRQRPSSRSGDERVIRHGTYDREGAKRPRGDTRGVSDIVEDSRRQNDGAKKRERYREQDHRRDRDKTRERISKRPRSRGQYDDRSGSRDHRWHEQRSLDSRKSQRRHDKEEEKSRSSTAISSSTSSTRTSMADRIRDRMRKALQKATAKDEDLSQRSASKSNIRWEAPSMTNVGQVLSMDEATVVGGAVRVLVSSEERKRQAVIALCGDESAQDEATDELSVKEVHPLFKGKEWEKRREPWEQEPRPASRSPSPEHYSVVRLSSHREAHAELATQSSQHVDVSVLAPQQTTKSAGWRARARHRKFEAVKESRRQKERLEKQAEEDAQDRILNADTRFTFNSPNSLRRQPLKNFGSQA